MKTALYSAVFLEKARILLISGWGFFLGVHIKQQEGSQG